MIKRLASQVCILLVIGIWSGVSSASTYSINRTVGGGTLSGTITTDNTIGALLSTNITAWDLDIVISPSTANLTETNSEFSIFGAVTGIIATAGELLFDASSSVDGGFGFQEGPPNNAASWVLCSGGATGCPSTLPTPPMESLINGLNSTSAALPAELISFGTVSAVPIPAAAWLFGSGLLGLVGIARRKKA